MARSITTIHQEIISNLVSAAASVGITLVPAEWSAYDYRMLLTFVAAVAIGTLEQLWDAYQVLINGVVASAAPSTAPWWKKMMLAFQFDATTPQILQFDTVNIAPYYVTVDAAKRVIAYCSVTPGTFGTTTLKLAAQVSGFPADLEVAYPGALAAANSYAKLLNVNGITVNAVTGASDKIYIDATIYYQGGYSAIITATVIAGIQAYLAAIPFDGVVLLSNLEVAIKAIPGVNDVVFANVQARPDATAYGAGSNLVIGGTEIARKYATFAGYIVAETTATHTLIDSLTFVAE
jgi:hypothetical protein